MSNLEVGIVGLPNVGKSTLFNAITKAGAEAANYPFCTIEPNVGVVEVPDQRLKVLHEMYNSKKTTPASIRFVDIAGLVKGAAQGEGLGNKFLSHIRQVDAVAHVVRCFQDKNITHVEGSIDPIRDIDIINTELCLADMETVEKRLDKVTRAAKSGAKEAKIEEEMLKKIYEILSDGKPARHAEITDDEVVMLKELNLLTMKPTLFIANVAEDEAATADQENAYVQKVKEYAAGEKAGVVVISAKVESEIAELDADEAKEFLKEMGLDESGLDKLIKAAFKLLGLLTFLTAGPDECRAWTITKGMKAPQAAGKIHTDIERGFIRAEIVTYDDLVAAGSTAAAKEKGQVRLEGKDYIMQDGDVTYFRFNV
ncbi:redox-regulated ATPase YchF [Pectinatus sottacetonis]|uniref:redox-regulated ATPase YchF n=1 Tax=Pectinatus sottacetonis TaxID=1002795 RepID=UPI0018C47092|nr:redox-regulated ATPase YchF [Pectinatus sottacetonis]